MDVAVKRMFWGGPLTPPSSADFNAFAAPVFDHEGKMALAVAGLGPAGLVPPQWNGALPKAILAAALAVSRELGWRGHAAAKP